MTVESSNLDTTSDIPLVQSTAQGAFEPGSPAHVDPFDPKALRLTESSQIGVKKVLTVINCTKPNRHVFVRTHAEEGYRLQTALFKDRVDNELYLVSPHLWNELAAEIQATWLFTAITRNNDLFLWPVPIPDPSGRQNNWHLSLLRAAELAMTSWIRVSSNMQAGLYDVHEAQGSIPEPEWPSMPFKEMLRICFGGRFINTVDHPVLQSLRGEA